MSITLQISRLEKTAEHSFRLAYSSVPMDKKLTIMVKNISVNE